MSDQVVMVTSATYNSDTITGNLIFSYTRSGTTVGNRADAEIYHTDKKLVSVDVSGTLSGIDIVSYNSIEKGLNDQGLVIVGKLVSNNSDVTITFSKCIFTGDDGAVNHSSEGSATANWEASSIDGVTDPISFS